MLWDSKSYAFHMLAVLFTKKKDLYVKFNWHYFTWADIIHSWSKTHGKASQKEDI